MHAATGCSFESDPTGPPDLYNVLQSNRGNGMAYEDTNLHRPRSPAERAGTRVALSDLGTPCLVLDSRIMGRNIGRLNARMAMHGVPLRPHLKTCKNVDIARLMMQGNDGPATVSTLREAEYFAAAGVRDIVYAVGISPDKFTRIAALRRDGTDLSVIFDSIEQADALGEYASAVNDRIPAMIEIDSD